MSSIRGYSDPGRAIEGLDVLVSGGGVQWVFPLTGAAVFFEMERLFRLPPPAAWDGITRVEGRTYCVRYLRPSPDMQLPMTRPGSPLRGCVVSAGDLPVALVFDRFLTGSRRPEFEPLGQSSAPFPGVTGHGQLDGVACYRVDTAKLIV